MKWKERWVEHQELLDWFEGYLAELEARKAPTRQAYFCYELKLIIGPTKELTEGLTLMRKLVTDYKKDRE